MNYRTEDNLSILGFGCMRFPRSGNSFDMEEIEKEILHAVDMGINYFDMAYIYPGVETAFGKVLAKNNIRDKINIATKLPHYLMKTREDMDKNFKEQLERINTDHIDYFLMHMLPDMNTFKVLVERGAFEWAEQLKKSGVIRKIGFSFHGNSDTFIELLNAYNWDFCQVQYNYLDEHSQAGRRGVEEAYRKNIPVIIMEPLRGGRLVNNLPHKAKAIINNSNRHYTAAEWSFRWLYNQPAVSVVLSGMNSMDMLDENIRIANSVTIDSFTDEDYKTINLITDAINEKVKIPCTGCSYCMPCPCGVDIPGSFSAYNRAYTDNFFSGIKQYIMCQVLKSEPNRASQCTQCGRCEQHCPQHIEIRNELKRVKKKYENPIFNVAYSIINNSPKRNCDSNK